MSPARPTLAVLIPNYNYARFLPQTLESALAQTSPFDEILVVDDGSTDNSIELLASYNGRVKVLSISNSGQLGACRAGLAVLTSDYVYSLDADDFVAPDMAATVRGALESRPAKVQFQLDGVDGMSRPVQSAFPTFPEGYDAAAMRDDNVSAGFYICPPTSGNVFSREILERMDLSKFDLRGVIDGSPTLAIPYFGEVVSINAPLASYRMHAGSMSNWSKPSVELLQRELYLFHKSWAEVGKVVAPDRLPTDPDRSMYVYERRLMIACLGGQAVVVHLALRFAARLLQTEAPFRQKMMFLAWAMLLNIPVPSLRRYIIQMKRSSLNRSRRLQAVLNLVLGVRRSKASSMAQ